MSKLTMLGKVRSSLRCSRGAGHRSKSPRIDVSKFVVALLRINRGFLFTVDISADRASVSAVPLRASRPVVERRVDRLTAPPGVSVSNASLAATASISRHSVMSSSSFSPATFIKWSPGSTAVAPLIRLFTRNAFVPTFDVTRYASIVIL